MTSFISGYYTVSQTASGEVYVGGKYASNKHWEDFKNEDCIAYCYHNGVNCKAYAISRTICNVLNLLNYSDTPDTFTKL